jgi:transcriptional regulator with XRE-family HTH domain
MPKSNSFAYARYSREAVGLLGQLIRAARTERKMTAMEVAERAGISRGRLQRIEKGNMTSEIGAVFEVAAIVGVELFDSDHTNLRRLTNQIENKLTLLPKSVRSRKTVLKDDF